MELINKHIYNGNKVNFKSISHLINLLDEADFISNKGQLQYIVIEDTKLEVVN